MKINLPARVSRLAPRGRGRHLDAVSLILTLILLAASVGLTVLAGWRGARPPDVVRGPRLIPWRFLMILAVAFSSLLLVHLGTLLGVPRRH